MITDILACQRLLLLHKDRKGITSAAQWSCEQYTSYIGQFTLHWKAFVKLLDKIHAYFATNCFGVLLITILLKNKSVAYIYLN